MKIYIENLSLTEMSKQEIIETNGGGVLRKYGVYLGEKVGSVLIWVGLALITKRFF